MSIPSLKLNSKLGATTTHLLISLVLLLGLLTTIFFVWYPNGLIYAGGIDGLKILIGVDLIVGPLLTFIVFVPGKKGLKFDLVIIGLVQASCLLLGMWMIYGQRPLAQVLIDDGVHLLSASDIQQYNVDLSSIDGPNPKHVLMDLPEDKASWQTVKQATEFVDGVPFAFRQDLYLPIKNLDEKVYAKRIQAILDFNNSEALAALNQSNQASCSWIPVISVHLTGYACHSFSNGIEALQTTKTISPREKND